MNFIEYFVGLNLKHFVGNFIGNFWSDISRGSMIVKKDVNILNKTVQQIFY